MEIRKDDAIAQGANTSETRKNAPSNEKCASYPKPAALASTAPDPKISTGM